MHPSRQRQSRVSIRQAGAGGVMRERTREAPGRTAQDMRVASQTDL